MLRYSPPGKLKPPAAKVPCDFLLPSLCSYNHTFGLKVTQPSKPSREEGKYMS